MFYLNTFSSVIYSCDVKVIITQSSVSHDPSEIILIWWCDAQETCFIINVVNSFAA